MSTEYIDETGPVVTPEIESIWLTRTSVKPIWLAITMMLTLIGMFAFWPLGILSGIAVIWIAIRWVGDSRHESDELPRA